MTQNEITIFSYWYTCPECRYEHSISTNNPISYNDIITCNHCKNTMIIRGLKGEPEIFVTNKKVNK